MNYLNIQKLLSRSLIEFQSRIYKIIYSRLSLKTKKDNVKNLRPTYKLDILSVRFHLL